MHISRLIKLCNLVWSFDDKFDAATFLEIFNDFTNESSVTKNKIFYLNTSNVRNKQYIN